MNTAIKTVNFKKTVYDRPSMILLLRTTQRPSFTHRTRPVITLINTPGNNTPGNDC